MLSNIFLIVCMCLTFVVTAVSGCQQRVDGESVPADETSNCVREAPCSVSFYDLISDPKEWNKKYVYTFGYFSIGRHPALFANQESSDYSILRNGVSIRLDDSINQHGFDKKRTDEWVPVTGLFTSRTIEKDELGQMTADDFSGEILEAQVFPYRSDAWSCAVASASIKKRYLREEESCLAHEATEALKTQVSKENKLQD